ncbi:hypothetical protein HMPREF9946_00894 [Acetobacteraceae bacterium AT-5844]|nr:hypothetical protein HMPREF9946_00894 [Acetobacteraceae bacterium AT-5844]
MRQPPQTGCAAQGEDRHLRSRLALLEEARMDTGAIFTRHAVQHGLKA